MTVVTDFIDVQISRDTTPVARESFNIPLFIAEHTVFSERVRTYNSITGVQEDGFTVGSPVYVAATKAFSQEIRPSQFLVGRKQVDGVDGSIATVTNLGVYTLTINNVEFEFTADGTATAIEIVAGLKAAYDLAPIAGITFTDSLDGTFDVVVAPAGTAWSIKGSSNIALVNQTSTETWPDAIAAVSAENGTWFGLNIQSHTDADILAVAAYIETLDKVFGYSSSAAAIKTTATTDIASQLKALGYTKTYGIYSPSADTEYPEIAWTAYQLQEQPGSNDWFAKTLIGVTPYKLTATETTNLRNKNIASYETVGGVSVTTGSKVASGEFIDVLVFILWMKARITERYWARFVNSKKIPCTQAGLAIFEAELRSQIAEGIRVGGLDEVPAPQVFVPRVLDIDSNLRAMRRVEGITFNARLAGSVQFVQVRGVVYV
jgi:hypothetical protein